MTGVGGTAVEGTGVGGTIGAGTGGLFGIMIAPEPWVYGCWG